MIAVWNAKSIDKQSLWHVNAKNELCRTTTRCQNISIKYLLCAQVSLYKQYANQASTQRVSITVLWDIGRKRSKINIQHFMSRWDKTNLRLLLIYCCFPHLMSIQTKLWPLTWASKWIEIVEKTVWFLCQPNFLYSVYDVNSLTRTTDYFLPKLLSFRNIWVSKCPKIKALRKVFVTKMELLAKL